MPEKLYCSASRSLKHCGRECGENDQSVIIAKWLPSTDFIHYREWYLLPLSDS